MAVQVTASTINSVITYVVAGCRSAYGTGIEVFDGPITVDNPTKAVCIGTGEPLPVDGDRNEAVSGVSSWRTIGATMRNEDYTLACCAASAVGGNDFSIPRADVFAMYATFDTLYRADLTLGGLVVTSSITSDFTLDYAFPSSGPIVVLRWGLTVKNVIR